MPRIEVLRTTRAAPDGITVRRYRAGEIHELPDHLARVFLREGWGRPARGLAGGARDEATRGLAGGARDGKSSLQEPATEPGPRRKRRRRRKRTPRNATS